jgi:type II secretory pathway component PulM
MTKQKWLLLGALIVSLLVVLYVVFLCPSNCH